MIWSKASCLPALFLLATISPASIAQYFPPPESSGGWRRLVTPHTTPTATEKESVRVTVGLDWDKLKQAWDVSAQYGGSFLVIRAGWIAGEWGTSTTAAPIASCTKTLTSLAIQRMFDMSAAGALGVTIGPDDLAYRYLPASWGSHATRRTISLRHILTMSSGLEPDDSPPGPSKDTSAYLQKILDPPVRTTPGTEWSYASLPVDTLSILMEQVTGSRLGDFFQQHIGNAIGVTTLQWAALDTHTYASAYAKATARDLARIAYLMLRRGSWNGQTIVSEARIAEMTNWDPVLAAAVYGPQIQFPTDPESHLRYGHLTWTNRTESAYVGAGVPADTYYFAGFRTKFVMVVPSLDLIIVRIQDAPGAWSDELFTEMTAKIVQAVVPTGTNEPPTAAITAPIEGSSFHAPADITIVADAGDPDGVVTQVAFLANGNVIGTRAGPPYEITWQDVQAGSYALTARSTDDAGASTVSAAVGVNVAGSFAVVPDALVFGNQPVDETSAAQDVIIQNTGNSDLPIDLVGLSGTHASQFSITDDCGTSLPPGGVCTIGVQFAPTSTGNKSASLTIEAGGVGETAAVSLAGTGVSVSPSASVSPTSIAFGKVRRGSTRTKSVTLLNSGSINLPIVSIRLGGSNPNQFRVAHDCGASLDPGAFCTASVTFCPTSKGQKKATLLFSFGDGADAASVSLKGTGI